MQKTIRLFVTLRDLAGSKTLSVPLDSGSTVRDLIQAINAANPAIATALLDSEGQLSDAVFIYVHGRNVIGLQGLDTPIREDDEIMLVPPMVGG
ncbi:MAG: MoaD family protein [Anaerolineae bacterium]|nr:MoaD family protein [Anaerolineae bacterium]